MHEYSLVSALINQIEEIAIKNEATQVKKVVVEYGPFSYLELHQAEFWWETLKTESDILTTTKLEFKLCKGKIFCLQCKKVNFISLESIKSSELSTPLITCPDCGSLSTEILEGIDVKIGKIELLFPE